MIARSFYGPGKQMAYNIAMTHVESRGWSDEYPAHYAMATPDEVIALHAIVARLGGVVTLTSFRITEDNVLPFAMGAVDQFDKQSDIDRAGAVTAFCDFAVEQSKNGRLAVVIHGPDKGQLDEIAFRAETETVLDDAPR